MRPSSLLLVSISLLLGTALPSLAIAEPAAKAQAGAGNAAQQRNVTAATTMESGRISAVDADGLVLEFRSGRVVRYARTDATTVRGEKPTWDALATGDNVKVRLSGSELVAVIVNPSASQAAALEEQRRKATSEFIKAQKAKAAAKKANPQAQAKAEARRKARAKARAKAAAAAKAKAAAAAAAEGSAN